MFSKVGPYLFLFLIVLTPILSHSQAFKVYSDGDSKDLNLTDEERELSKKYINKGLEGAILTEGCEGIEKECRGQESDEKFLGIPNKMVEMLGQAYTMINGSMTQGLQLTPEAHQAAMKENPQAPANRPDYCAKIPMVGESMAQFMQQSEQNNMASLPSGEETDQKTSLYKAARSHEVRSTTSTIQASVYGAGGACYAGMVAMGGVQLTEVAVKLPATALLAGFYAKNAIDQKKMSDKIKALANKLPGPGDCNPITQRKCFCKNYKELKKVAKKWDEDNKIGRKETDEYNEKLRDQNALQSIGSLLGFGGDRKIFYEKTITLDHVNYQKYCTSILHESEGMAPTSEPVTCVDYQGKMDPFCECTKTDSCLDKQFISNIKAIGKTPYTDEALSDLVALSRGELRGGTLGDGGVSSFNAAKGAIKKFALEMPVVPLDAAGKEAASFAETYYGVPKEFAAQLASRQASPREIAMGKSIVAGATGNLRKKFKTRTASNDSKGSNNLDLLYGGGAGLNQRKLVQDRANAMAQKGPAGKVASPSSVMNFAEEASKAAQINHRPEVSVWQIISRRYQFVSSRGLIISEED